MVKMPAATLQPESAVETLIKQMKTENTSLPDHLHDLAVQILHNLQYQHRWTDLKIHSKAPESGHAFTRPLISGLPPKRLYMHPDEQAELLKQQTPRTASEDDDADDVSPLEKPVMEWVLPTHLREKWSLRKFAEVFDALDWPKGSELKPWEVHKRVVLATLQDDSTIVYYVGPILVLLAHQY